MAKTNCFATFTQRKTRYKKRVRAHEMAQKTFECLPRGQRADTWSGKMVSRLSI